MGKEKKSRDRQVDSQSQRRVTMSCECDKDKACKDCRRDEDKFYERHGVPISVKHNKALVRKIEKELEDDTPRP